MAIRLYVARQPILDWRGRTLGYELLYRDSLENLFRYEAQEEVEDKASWKVLAHAFLNFGINNLAFGKRVFINFTARLLREGVPYLLPPQKLMIEILERVENSRELMTICKKLRERGYTLVLDDFRLGSPLESLIPLVDFLKVDFKATPWEEIEAIAKQYGHLKLIGEKIETQEEFERAHKLGYTYFQGFFFARPKIVTAREIPIFKRHYLRLMNLLHSPDIDLAELVDIINSEPSLALKLLRYINSAFFGFPQKIRSVRHAAVLLGQEGLRKWGSLISIVSLAADRPPELVILSIVRARFMEMLARECGLEDRTEDAFIVGLLSLLEAMMDQPLHMILRDLPLDKDIENALLEKESPFTPLLQVVRAYEEGRWTDLQKVVARLPLSSGDILPDIYTKALSFAHRAFALGK